MDKAKEYKQKLASLVPAARAAYSLPEFKTAAQLAYECEAWFNVLYREVPLAKLHEVTFAAVKAKIKTQEKKYRRFGAADVLMFYSEEMQKKSTMQELQKPCNTCGGSKKIKVYSPQERKEVEKQCPFHSNAQTQS